MIAADKDSKRLGEVCRIGKLPHKLTKKPIPHIFIFVQQFMQKDTVVPISADHLLKVKGEYVWFDILKKDFDKDVKHYRKLKEGSFVDFEELQDYSINLRANYYFNNRSPVLRRQEYRKE